MQRKKKFCPSCPIVHNHLLSLRTGRWWGKAGHPSQKKKRKKKEKIHLRMCSELWNTTCLKWWFQPVVLLVFALSFFCGFRITIASAAREHTHTDAESRRALNRLRTLFQIGCAKKESARTYTDTFSTLCTITSKLHSSMQSWFTYTLHVGWEMARETYPLFFPRPFVTH